MKKFKSRRKKKIGKVIFFIALILFSSIITFNYKLKLNLKSSNEEFIKLLLNDSNYYKKYEGNNFFKWMEYIFNMDLKNPESLLKNAFHYKNKLKSNNEYRLISNNSKENITEPLIYIYNTHQLEKYNQDNYKEYNITPNVLMASYLLKGLLDKEGINTIVEENSINDFLSVNGWNYNKSYEASRYFVRDTLDKNSNLKLIIDLHRDSIKKEKSTVLIGDKNYAKILFVIGQDHDNYLENLNVATKLDNIIKENYSDISRGISIKGGEGVNGIYNQDLNNKIILIEIGGEENTIDEVLNTIKVLKDSIKKYLEE